MWPDDTNTQETETGYPRSKEARLTNKTVKSRLGENPHLNMEKIKKDTRCQLQAPTILDCNPSKCLCNDTCGHACPHKHTH